MAEAMPEIDQHVCTLCGDCLSACPAGALSLVSHRVVLDEAKCRYCGDCEDVCPRGAIRLPYEIVLLDGERGPGDGARPNGSSGAQTMEASDGCSAGSAH